MSNGARTITKLVDERCVVVMDPDEDALENGVPGVPKPIRRKEVAAGVRKKERRYVFDAAYDGEASNEQVYRGTVLPHIAGVLRGTNATVFAYGATGSGKTHTMVGDTRDPGLMVLSLRDVFRFISSDSGEKDYKVECSYTEVYNELVYDLLVPNSQPLELREDPERGPMVSGLTHVRVTDENAIFELLRKGNGRRKTEVSLFSFSYGQFD
jgi:kinesin family protein 18/19